MKLLWWRRKADDSREGTTPKDHTNAKDHHASVATLPPNSVARSEVPTTPLGLPPIELRDALLAFARTYLVASGARVRVEAPDLISATLGDGTAVRYTTTLARARAEEHTDLLVQGGGALASLVEECAVHARITSLRLAVACEPAAVARAACAAPAANCTRCLDATASAPATPCPGCPLRDGRFVLHGLGRVTAARELRREDEAGVELTYHIVASDRQGRRDEWTRIGLSGPQRRQVAPVTPDALSAAEATMLPADTDAAIDGALAQAQEQMQPALDALGAFLRLRSEGEYQQRLDDIRSTAERLQREGNADAATTEASLAREIDRLNDIYAVAVTAQLESVATIATPVAQVTLTTTTGGKFTLAVDAGRGVAIAPACAMCGAATPVGALCGSGHITCLACRAQRAATGAEGCPACASIPIPITAASAATGSVAAPAKAAPRRSAKRPTVARAGISKHLDATGLRLEHLDAMTAETWQAFVSWLLTREGYQIERISVTAGGPLWHGRANAGQVVASAPRLEAGWSLAADDVQRVVALASTTPKATRALVTTALADASAHEAAQRLGLRLWDRTVLRELLTQAASAHQRERDVAHQQRLASVAAASRTRQSLLAALDAFDDGLTRAAASTSRATTRAAVVAAVTNIRERQPLLSQALLAWETLLADWHAAFGAREARDGSLAILGTPQSFDALSQRAEHLGTVLAPALATLARAPGGGDLGYEPWRTALLEELHARCESLRLRAEAIKPEQWQQFSAAYDSQALEQAEVATSAAAHARTRVANAYAQLETRARLTPTEAAGA